MSDATAAATDATAAATVEKGWPTWADTFLIGLGETGMVASACERAGVQRSTAYRLRQRDEAFALAWADIESETTDRMEREALRRAVEGVAKPVYQKGELVGHVREFSDTLLIFMLKARKPEVYRENVRVEHSGGLNNRTVVEIPDDEERRSEVARILAGALD
jgi:hypothetical protein